MARCFNRDFNDIIQRKIIKIIKLYYFIILNNFGKKKINYLCLIIAYNIIYGN